MKKFKKIELILEKEVISTLNNDHLEGVKGGADTSKLTACFKPTALSDCCSFASNCICATEKNCNKASNTTCDYIYEKPKEKVVTADHTCSVPDKTFDCVVITEPWEMGDL